MDVAQHLGPRPDQDAIADLGVAIALILAGAAQRHRMQHRDIVAHHRGFTDHDRMGVVDHDAAAHAGGGVDVDAKDLGHAHLHEIGHVAPPLAPQPVADAIGLQRLEALEEQDRLQEPVTGRVAVMHGNQIGARRRPQIGVGRMGGVGDFAQDLLAHLARGELQRKPVGERVFQRGMVQKAGMDQPAEQGFGPHRRLGLGTDPGPDRVDRRNFCPTFRHDLRLLIFVKSSR